MSAEVVYGRNPVHELVAAGRRRVHDVWALGPLAATEPWLRELRPRERSRADLSRAAGSPDHQGVVAFCDPYPYAAAGDVLVVAGPVVCLDGVQDPRNLGAVARVVEAVGGAGIAIARRGSPGVTPAACKASAGAVEHLRIAQVDNLASFVHDARGGDRWAFGADPGEGADYRDVDWGGDPILVVGAEGQGLRPRVRRMCDCLVRIPMRGRVGSLNLSVAVALLLFEARRTK